MFVACRPCIWACLVQCKYSSGCGKNPLVICFGMGIVGSVCCIFWSVRRRYVCCWFIIFVLVVGT
jgi:hypothetical protein